jgi:hypothetical protein
MAILISLGSTGVNIYQICLLIKKNINLAAL